MGCEWVHTKTFTIPEIETPDKIIEDISFQHFKKKELLGQGSFGKVYLIRSKETGKHYALKEIYFDEKKNPNQKKYHDLEIQREIENLRKIDHPNVISFKGSFKSKEKENIYNIITEYADNGDLYKLLQEKKKKKEYFEEKQLLNWLIQMCLALYNLHEKEIIHRDIKPSNIFLMKDNTIKLGDFGISKDISGFHRTKTNKGTPLYMAPEILNSQKYDFKIDVWSLGVTFCHLMTLEFPFYSEKLEENIKKGIKNKNILNEEGNYYNDIILKRYSKEFLDIIDEMMTIDPKERPEIEDILQKKIVVERMESLLIESKFNFEKADIEIKKYQENEQRILKLIKERLNKKEEQFDEINYIIIEDISEKDIKEEKNENAILTQQINQLQNDRLKYNYLRQMSLIHTEKLKRIKTTTFNI